MAQVNAQCVDCHEDQTAYGQSVDADVVYGGTSLCWDHYVVARDRVAKRREVDNELRDSLLKVNEMFREVT